MNLFVFISPAVVFRTSGGQLKEATFRKVLLDKNINFLHQFLESLFHDGLFKFFLVLLINVVEEVCFNVGELKEVRLKSELLEFLVP